MWPDGLNTEIRSKKQVTLILASICYMCANLLKTPMVTATDVICMYVCTYVCMQNRIFGSARAPAAYRECSNISDKKIPVKLCGLMA